MFNYQGLLNPANFAQNRMMPTGASYWMQYAQPPSPLSLPIPLPQQGAGGGPGTPTPPGTPPGPTPPVTPPVLPPGTPPRPPGPAGGGDTGWGGQQSNQPSRFELMWRERQARKANRGFR